MKKLMMTIATLLTGVTMLTIAAARESKPCRIRADAGDVATTGVAQESPALTFLADVSPLLSDVARISVHEGYWGSWRKNAILPRGKEVTSFQVRFEPYQHGGDDTGMNGIRIRGRYVKPFTGGTLPPDGWTTVDDGYWGDWGRPVTIPAGYRIIGMSVRTESRIGSGDDTSLNGLTVICSKGETIRRIVVEKGRWGHWKPDAMVPTGYYVCGMQMRVESKQGSGDDTAGNGVRMLIRKLPK